jgi:hypothetical protein
LFYVLRFEFTRLLLPVTLSCREQRKTQEQGATIARLEKQVAALAAGLEKVTAQVQASKPAPQVAHHP